MAILAVLGMHRSGTSLVAGVLRELGWGVGPERDLMPAKPDNPRGFVEHLPAVRINDRLLYRCGGSWREPPALPPGWELDPDLDDLLEEARVVAEHLEGHGDGRVLFKDPRLSLTLPFWQRVAEIPQAVMVLRPPGAVVRSLLRREEGLTAAAAATLCTRYLLAGLRSSARLHVVDPRDLTGDGRVEAVRRLAISLGHEPEADAVQRATDEFVDSLWGRSSDRESSDIDCDELVLAQHVHDMISDAHDGRVRAALAHATTVEEVAAAARTHDATAASLHAEANEARALAERLTAALAEARTQRDRLRTERDAAQRRADALQADLAEARAAIPAGDSGATEPGR